MDEKESDVSRLVSGAWGEDGRPITRARLTHASDDRVKVIDTDMQAVIPIVFIPGIMGTNLKSRDNGNVVWRPPNMDGVGAILGAIGQLIAFAFRGAATRQRRLHPDRVEVDDDGPLDAEGAIDDALARKRGWGALMRSSYNPVMAELQRKLNDIMVAGKLQAWWQQEALRSPDQYGEEVGGNPPLEDADLRHAANYRYEVWGGGYNWLQSNRESGQDIISRINDVVRAHYLAHGMSAEKVILMTHSMGGLVGRAVACIHSFPDLLGVVHGVMPATGAAATYHHCRAGYEGISSVILGRNAGEVVAILAQAPGGLELLPAADYNAGSAWLRLGDHAAAGSSLPANGDPYGEIYLSTAWYGLVPDHNTELLDPAGMRGVVADDEMDGMEKPSPRQNFEEMISEVARFHGDIAGKYHENTFSHFGDDAGQLSWSEIVWEGAHLPGDEAWAVAKDDHNGKIEIASVTAQAKLRIAAPAQPGDGTVPATSGGAPTHHVKASFRQGGNGLGAFVGKDDKGYDHQESYNDERARWASIYGVVRSAALADWE